MSGKLSASEREHNRLVKIVFNRLQKKHPEAHLSTHLEYNVNESCGECDILFQNQHRTTYYEIKSSRKKTHYKHAQEQIHRWMSCHNYHNMSGVYVGFKQGQPITHRVR